MEDRNLERRVRRLAEGSGITMKKVGGIYHLSDAKTGAAIADEPSLRDVAIRLQRLGILGYGGAG